MFTISPYDPAVLIGVSFLFVIVAALLLWAAVSPRSQWRILMGWVNRGSEAIEPSDRAHSLRRVAGIVGIIPLILVGFRFYETQRSAPQVVSVPPTYQAAQAEAGHLWSSATGSVSLNTSPPVENQAPPTPQARLVPLAGYAAVDPANRAPAYLYALYSGTGQTGSPDPNTFLLVGSASGCDPEQLMVTESANEIRVGLFEVPYSNGQSLQDCLNRNPNNGQPAMSLYPIDHAPGASVPFGRSVGQRKVVDMATGKTLKRIG